jgi:hypothetical protein
VIVAAHQPNFAPWLGFFDKLRHADAFVVLDTVPFTKRALQNRVKVKGPSGPQWLTIPVVSKGRYGQPTNDVAIDEEAKWRQVHLQTIQTLLGKAPYRDVLLETLEPLYADRTLSRLVDFNMAVIRAFVTRLGITTPLLMASDLHCEGQATQLLIDLTKAAGGDVYLSGPTGRDYLEPERFGPAGVRLAYHEFQPFEYPQQFGEFVGGLSCLDYVANVGFVPWSEPAAAPEPVRSLDR